MEENRLSKRKHLPHFPAIERCNHAVVHFVTICTKDRRALLASELVHQSLLEAWSAADSFIIGRYILMPNHIHLFCAPGKPLPDYLTAWIRYWKSLVTRRLSGMEKGQLWQRDFWDTQMRRGENYTNKWDYVRFNPVRQGLVKNPADWPYQGEIHRLEWHDLATGSGLLLEGRPPGRPRPGRSQALQGEQVSAIN